ncbi:recombinase-like helix-turn-helix domain-containing protein [Caballeronia arvi]|uniref:recombinase-like helix-turn-helix domain-containing protein n=1 Tax=Caballeronia arvi TaxID=1777135 RepID=UPI002E12E849
MVLGATGPANLKRNIEDRQRTADSFAANLARTIKSYRAAGLTQRQIVEELNRTGVTATRGGRWTLGQLQRVIARLPSSTPI